jgi:hypothetical protein
VLRLIIPIIVPALFLRFFLNTTRQALIANYSIGNKRIVCMYKNILVPVDVFEIGLADKALSHAQFLAQSASGKIHLVHVNLCFPRC